MAVGHVASKFIMEKCTGEVKVTDKQAGEARAAACVCEIGTKDECAVGGVRGPCVCIVVGLAWLAAAIYGKSGGNCPIRLLLYQHLAAKKYCSGLNARTGDEFEGLICIEVLPKLFCDASLYVGGWEYERCLTD